MFIYAGERFIHTSDKCLCMLERVLYSPEINFLCMPEERFMHTRDKCLCIPGEVYTHQR